MYAVMHLLGMQILVQFLQATVHNLVLVNQGSMKFTLLTKTRLMNLSASMMTLWNCLR